MGTPSLIILVYQIYLATYVNTVLLGGSDPSSPQRA